VNKKKQKNFDSFKQFATPSLKPTVNRNFLLLFFKRSAFFRFQIASKSPFMHLFNVDPYSVALLPETAAPDIQSLFEHCEDYLQLVEGRPPATDAAILEWRDRPPGCGPGDVFCLALRDTTGLAGVIFALRNFPTSGDWYLGLSLLHPARRGPGGRILPWLRSLGRASMRPPHSSRRRRTQPARSAFLGTPGFHPAPRLPGKTNGAATPRHHRI
jgi:hypothetical protein